MFTLGFDKTRQCLVGIYKGMYSEEIFTACTDKVRSAVETNPCKRFVMDMRQADMLVKTIDFKKWYFTLYKAGLDEEWKKVILLPEDCYQEIADQQILKEYEDIRVSGNIKDAVQWLTT